MSWYSVCLYPIGPIFIVISSVLRPNKMQRFFIYDLLFLFYYLFGLHLATYMHLSQPDHKSDRSVPWFFRATYQGQPYFSPDDPKAVW